MKQLQYFTIPRWLDKAPSRLIIYGWCNVMSNWNTAPEEISNSIADIALVCCACGLNVVFFLPLTSRKNNYWNGKETKLHFFLSNNREKGFVLIDNEDIDLDDHSAERCISLLLFFIPSFFRKMQPPFPLSRHPSRKNTTFCNVTWESGRLKTINIKPWKLWLVQHPS